MRTELELWRLEHEALERRAGSLSVEIHKKFSLPAACVVFVFIGAPLGMRVRRAGPAVAFVSVAFFLFYYLCLVGGEELANRLLLPPWLAMWLPNLVLGTWGLLATLRAIEVWRPRALRVTPWRRGARAPGTRCPRAARRRTARVRILDRYLLREFAGYLALGLVGIIAIFVVVDVFEKIDVFLDHHAAFSLIGALLPLPSARVAGAGAAHRAPDGHLPRARPAQQVRRADRDAHLRALAVRHPRAGAGGVRRLPRCSP